jgi:pyridoxamine 5'-phosphate oxidase
MNNEELAAMRRNYTRAGLTEQDAHANPFVQFRLWFAEAKSAQILEPNAMTLATANASGEPSARVVLLKELDEQGFVFYTNYQSDKAQDIAANARVSLNFFWGELERQVRVQGAATKVSREESEAYFQTRPRESQIGAWASQQSSVVASREDLARRFQELSAEFEGRDIPCPPFWGGYRVKPSAIEFWQGRPGRLHDRLLYTCADDGFWRVERLSP